MSISGISPALASLQQGFSQASRRTLAAANEVVEATGQGDLGGAVQGVVKLNTAKVQTQALAQLVKAQDRALGSVLDILG